MQGLGQTIKLSRDMYNKNKQYLKMNGCVTGKFR